MRAVRERPRVVAAQAIGLAVVFALGLVVGGALDSSPPPRTPVAVQDRLSQLEREAKVTDADRQKARATETRLRAELAARDRRLRSAASRERRLRAALRRPRR